MRPIDSHALKYSHNAVEYAKNGKPRRSTQMHGRSANHATAVLAQLSHFLCEINTTQLLFAFCHHMLPVIHHSNETKTTDDDVARVNISQHQKRYS